MADVTVVDVEVADVGPIAHSPIAPSGSVAIVEGWQVCTRSSTAALRLIDLSSLAKVAVRATPGGAVARALNVVHGRAARDLRGRLVIGSGPDEWLIVAPVGAAPSVAATLVSSDDPASAGEGDLVTVIDVTHGRALMRLSGLRSASALEKLCAIDLSDRATPDGRALRSSVAKLVTDVVRDDREGEPSYLLHCERSSGQFLFDAVLDAGAEFGIDVAGMSGESVALGV